MNDARKKVEDFKKTAHQDVLKQIRWSITVEKKGLDYHAQQRAERIAFDNYIAHNLGVILTDEDHETWPLEHGTAVDKEWAAGLPDK